MIPLAGFRASLAVSDRTVGAGSPMLFDATVAEICPRIGEEHHLREASRAAAER